MLSPEVPSAQQNFRKPRNPGGTEHRQDHTQLKDGCPEPWPGVCVGQGEEKAEPRPVWNLDT